MNGFGLKRLEELTLKKDSKPEEICLAIDCINKLLKFYIFTQDFKLQCASTLLRVSESFSHDSDVIMKCFQVFSFLLHCERMKRNKHKAVRFFLAGEAATIQNVFQLHQEQNAEVRVIGKEILNDLQFFSADAALLKIEKVKQSSDLGITVKIFQQVQSSCSKKNSPKGIVTGEETDDVALVLAEMNRYPSHEGIQQKGLEVVASLLESKALASLTTNTKLIMSIVDIVISSIASKHSELQRLGLSILLILTKDMYICNKFARKGACRTLVQQLISREIYQEYRQTAIWSLSYLCNEDYCRKQLEESDLDILLCTLSEDQNIILPLTLRLMHEEPDLKQADRFNPMHEKKNKDKTFIQNRSSLPRIKKDIYIKSMDLFSNGEPGLI